MRSDRLWTVPLTALVLSCAGCGYHFVGSPGSQLPREIGSVSVQPFENRTPEASLGMECARALSNELAADREADGPSYEADLVLIGVVSEIEEHPVAFSSAADPRVELELALQGEVAALRQGREVTRAPFRGTATYSGAGLAAAVRTERRRAIGLACRQAMRDTAALLALELQDRTTRVRDTDGNEAESQ